MLTEFGRELAGLQAEKGVLNATEAINGLRTCRGSALLLVTK